MIVQLRFDSHNDQFYSTPFSVASRSLLPLGLVFRLLVRTQVSLRRKLCTNKMKRLYVIRASRGRAWEYEGHPTTVSLMPTLLQVPCESNLDV